ncbi:MAG: amylo-alpha-1,6-glucosidase [Bacteroidales bacterium]|nr:amylo-alpha-1,6-glucosidase [Bacteroidales bacterium]
MGKIIFNKHELVKLGYSLEREILKTSSNGAYASTSLCFCNTRKYHGLLIVPQPQIDNEYHVILSSLDETIIQDDYPFNLAIHRYPNEIYSPKGHKYLTSYDITSTGKHMYSVGDICLSKELIFSSKEDRLIIKYSVDKCDRPFKIQFNPFLAFRQRHKLSKANSQANTSFEDIENGASFKLYSNYEPLCIQFSDKKIKYLHNPDWYYNIEYIKEAERGYESQEDLLVPGYFEAKLEMGDTLFFTAAMNKINPKKIEDVYNQEAEKIEPLTSFDSVLRRAAKEFFVKKDKKVDVLAGYPWFGRWGRDSFIALPGLCIGLNDMKSFKKAIDTLIEDMRDGLFPNIGSGNDSAYNSVDAPMWFFWALQQYVEYTKESKKVWKEYKEVMVSILDSYRYGKTKNIKMMPNGMIYASENNRALTWMDAVVGDQPVTPRKGMCVEINALWYNAIMFTLELAKESKDIEFISNWEELAESLPQEFKLTFWDKTYGWLADNVDGYHKDFTVRPNMVFATSLKYRCISPKICQLVLSRIEKELLTPFGLRTLSPTHKDYKDVYRGSQKERDIAYHQGTVWPWLLGHFIEGYLKVYKECAYEVGERIYQGFGENINNYGISGIAEVYDGNPPYHPGGSISQAWSVSELLRIRYMLDNYKELMEGGKV